MSRRNGYLDAKEVLRTSILIILGITNYVFASVKESIRSKIVG
jgi:hypothetical protein